MANVLKVAMQHAIITLVTAKMRMYHNCHV